MMKAAFLGLGVMGYPMAGHLSALGDLTVYNRTEAKAQKWASEHKGRHVAQPADAVQDADIIMLCLGDDKDVRDVVDAMEPGLKAGAIVVDHTTDSPALARELHHRFANQKIGFIDAPVSGGEAGAVNGALSVMCGGNASDLEKAQTAIETFSKRVIHVGEAGAGQLCKAVNQICIAGLVQGLSEAVHFAQSAGLDIDKVYDAVSGGAAQSWQMNNRMKTMAADEFEFGFAVDWMRKDLHIALEEARVLGVRLPVTALVDQFYGDVQAQGGGRWDTSSLLRRLMKE